MSLPIRAIIHVDEIRCLGCGQCLNACFNRALKIEKDLVVLKDDALCRGKGRCVTSCKASALKLVERAASPYEPPLIDA